MIKIIPFHKKMEQSFNKNQLLLLSLSFDTILDEYHTIHHMIV